MAERKQFLIKFYGVRGSHPVSSSDVLQYGGNTSCILVKAGGHNIILDSGTGIISVGKELIQNNPNNPIKTTILISHCHLDHILGFQYFQPAFIPSTKINIFGSKNLDVELIDIIKNLLNEHFSPVLLEERPAEINISNIDSLQTILLFEDGHIEIANNSKSWIESDDNIVKILCFKSFSHPRNGINFYKITWKNKSVVYASDTEEHDNNSLSLAEFAKDADILIHDAQYIESDYNSSCFPKHGFGHSTPKMATQTAIKASVKKLILFHYDPNYSDQLINKIEAEAKTIFPNTMASYEGLEIDLFS